MKHRAEGFTLAEIAVILVIIAVLAAFAVPKLLASTERCKAAEAFEYLTAVRAAQERFHVRRGIYAQDLGHLKVRSPAPGDFAAGKITAGPTGSLKLSWSLTLTRLSPTAGYTDYTVTFTQEGFDQGASTISDHRDINPMQT